MNPNLDLWIGAGPSRRLKKAYAALAIVEREIARVRESNPCPEHAPTSYRIIRGQLRDLQQEHYRLLKRIGQLDGDDNS